MTKDTSKYIVTDGSQLVQEVADLHREHHSWPDGRKMTEANTDQYTKRAVGRPSLGEHGSTSPQIAFRIPSVLRERAEKVAVEEGITVSALAREALETYVANR